MREIDINIEGYNVNGICVGCLNYNRLMFYEDAVVKLCFKLIADIDLPDGLTIQLCWECLAAIKKVIRFRDQILKSHDVLVGYSQKHTFLDSPEDFTKHATTHLVCTPVQIDSFHNVEEPTEVKDENKVDIEIDTVKVKDEPESFYNYFDKVEDTQDCDDKIEDTQDFDDKIFEDFQNQNDTQNLSSDEDLQLSELKKKKERKDKKKKGKKKVKEHKNNAKPVLIKQKNKQGSLQEVAISSNLNCPVAETALVKAQDVSTLERHTLCKKHGSQDSALSSDNDDDDMSSATPQDISTLERHALCEKRRKQDLALTSDMSRVVMPSTSSAEVPNLLSGSDWKTNMHLNHNIRLQAKKIKQLIMRYNARKRIIKNLRAKVRSRDKLIAILSGMVMYSLSINS